MNSREFQHESRDEIPNGDAAAAILSAGAGCFLVSLFGLLGDAFSSVAHFFDFYDRTGPLSGVTTSAIIVWLILWATLSQSWKKRTVPLDKINRISISLLVLGLFLSFPPFADLLQGK